MPKIYWKPRGSTQVWTGEGTKPEGLLQFGGRAFSPDACTGIWKDFPPSFYFSPDDLKEEVWVPQEPTFSLPKLISRQDAPAYDQWWMMVNDALEKIEKDHFKKVVLARQTTLTFDGKIDPFQILNLLMPLGNQTSLFLLQMDDDTALVGASPEKLFHRQNRKIVTEAVAGTVDAHEEWSRKEFLEIDAVRVFLQERLLQFCSKIEWHLPQQKHFATLRHLYQSIEGKLKDGVIDDDIFSHLQPTPALGGYPQKEALEYIAGVEPFSRGWFGGLIGMTSPDETDMAVAIRCTLVQGNTMHLCAGTGIVKGSKPDKEWEELDQKMAHFTRYL